MNVRVAHGTVILPDATAFPCALGCSGVGVKEREGDGITPIGTFPLRQVWFRADRMEFPVTGLPLRAIEPEDIWIDAPDHPLYNRLSRAPETASHEELWRQDGIYDLFVEIGFNDDPVRPGGGSAIFLHIARENYAATAGCVALERADLIRTVRQLEPGSTITIESPK